MKRNALGWLVVVALSGCGLGAGTGDTSRSNGNLNGGSGNGGVTTDPGKEAAATDACANVPSGPMPCEAEALAHKACIVAGGTCATQQSAVDQCLGALPQPPPYPCEAEAIAYKECVGNPNGNGPSCALLEAAFNTCEAANPPPPATDPGTAGCKPPPPPGCDEEKIDKCAVIADDFKACTLKTPNLDCDAYLDQLAACDAGDPGSNPPQPDKP